jgi:enamine deaminase RidA (YjgF/YER057c/UK114 family)
MSHTRIRQFNTSQVYRGQKFDNDFCNAVVADNLVFLRGQVGMDLDTNESVGIGDPTAQTEKAMSNIEMLLDEAGARLEDICKLVVYVTDVRYREPVYQVIGRWLRGVYPCSTGIVVSGLARREWVVEIDATAVIPHERTAVTQ